jgi:hypothetical protein
VEHILNSFDWNILEKKLVTTMANLFVVGFVLHGLEAVVLVEAQRGAELIEERFGIDTGGILTE